MPSGVSDFVSDPLGSRAAARAANAQTAASKDANKVQKYIFDTQRKDAEPWRQAGMAALTGLQDDDYMRDFTMNDFQADPGYEFRMAEGMKAIERSAAAKGGLGSGATLKALTRFSQGTASDEFNNAYNRFNADRDRRFNRLSSLAGVGQTANSQVAQAGQNYANAYGQNVIGAGNAQAAAIMAPGNNMRQLAGMAGGYAIMASDERLKTNIRPADDRIEQTLEMLEPASFEYIDEKHGVGERFGIMAQDLEKSELGQLLVIETPDGKAVDLNKAMGLVLAASVRMLRRIKELEAKVGA
jgi:hypothetical protein